MIKGKMLQSIFQDRKEFNQHMRDNFFGNEILESFDSFSAKDAKVWIDPLDGTSQYVKGNLSAVTVLIGLAINNVSKIGIAHHPFRTNQNDGVGFTLFGS